MDTHDINAASIISYSIMAEKSLADVPRVQLRRIGCLSAHLRPLHHRTISGMHAQHQLELRTHHIIMHPVQEARPAGAASTIAANNGNITLPCTTTPEAVVARLERYGACIIERLMPTSVVAGACRPSQSIHVSLPM